MIGMAGKKPCNTSVSVAVSTTPMSTAQDQITCGVTFFAWASSGKSSGESVRIKSRVASSASRLFSAVMTNKVSPTSRESSAIRLVVLMPLR